jgi:hypothetical protein
MDLDHGGRLARGGENGGSGAKGYQSIKGYGDEIKIHDKFNVEGDI